MRRFKSRSELTPEELKEVRNYAREYRIKHKDKIAEYLRKWYIANREKVLVYQRIYRNSNKEKCKEMQRRYYERNKDKMIEVHKKWRNQHKDYMREYYYKRKSQRIKNKYSIHTNHRVYHVSFDELHGMQTIYITKPKKDIMKMSLDELIATQNDW